MSRLWYKEPAGEWEQALPLGNGRMGAMVFGEPVAERIQVNEDSMWYGGPVDRNNPDTKENLPKIRELILNGEIKKAERLMKMAMSGCPDSAHPYQTLGDILFTFENIGKVTEYERFLDIDTAVYGNRFTADGISYQREMFLSVPDDVLVMHFTADKPGAITFQAILRRQKFFEGVKKAGNNGICLYGTLGKGGSDYAMQLAAYPTGGSVQVIGEHLLVENADEVLLLFTAGTTYRMKRVEKELEDILYLATRKTYAELLKRHIQDYRSCSKE